ncbi:hypothetical protein OJAV_G00076470 [Oryzias javanicus]|uniref:Scaffolding anchor of CK1 domain-containing protein n=1 Tax=Oryzias javanicus TaxID=123683 RepID=A0A437D2G4_ORYJA|nr:hypothetical protein OJAV_G00076470 [Oryzias javanicus]
MALSQIQCLDDNHVNLRTSESKPEFFYCEDQRLALETLLQNGREAFFKYLDARGVRGFLSDPELAALVGAAEPFDPGSELLQGSVEDEPVPLSLHYWPELSDTSVPQMDLGWPSCDSYRGVTRTSVYTQPPLEGHAHIKEVVRKMIAQAQKVIAVVMDIFTDVDIFRDLLDAGFKRKVSVYILLERTTLPYFLSMCQRAGMHAGHLKNLRVRCSQGAEFFSRHCMKVRGRMGHRFMFIDGDKAVSGSYSFTWMSSRLDRNLITVITGQAVEGFDKLFRSLYVNSSSVDLRQVATEPEPEPDLRPYLAPTVTPSAAVLRKLHNPKYALVALTNPGVTASAGDDSPKEADISENNKKKRRKEEASPNPHALHPGLINLEKASLIAYLPIWPEPDPSSDVIGFINIRDANKPLQVHLQRSEMFGTSQAIKFSSPLSKPEENLAEIPITRQLSSKQDKINIAEEQAHKHEKLVVDKAQAEPHNDPGELKSRDNVFEHEKGQSETSKTETKVLSNTNLGPKKRYVSVLTIRQSNRESLMPNKERPLHKTHPILANKLNSTLISDVDMKGQEKSITNLNAQSTALCTAPTVGSNSGQRSPLPDLNTAKDTLESALQSQVQAVNMQLEVSSEITPNPQTTNVENSIFTSSASSMQSRTSTSVSKNSSVAITTLHSSPASSLHVNVSSTTSASSLSNITTIKQNTPSEPSFLASNPSIPKRHSVELVMKDTINNNGQTEIYVRNPVASLEPQTLHNESVVETRKLKSQVKITETVPEQLDNISNKSIDGKRTNNPQNDQYLTKLQTLSDCLITGAKNTAGTQESIPNDSKTRTGTKTLTLTYTDAKTSEVNLKSCKSTDDVTECHPYFAKSHELHRVSCSVWTSKDNCESQDVDILKAGMKSNPTTSKNSDFERTQKSVTDTLGLQEGVRSASAYSTDHGPKDAKANTGQTQENTHNPRNSVQFPNAHQPDLHEEKFQFITAVVQTPDALPQRSVSPDEHNEHVSNRRDSTQSTTSEEYFECTGSPLHGPVDQSIPNAHEIKNSTGVSDATSNTDDQSKGKTNERKNTVKEEKTDVKEMTPNGDKTKQRIQSDLSELTVKDSEIKAATETHLPSQTISDSLIDGDRVEEEPIRQESALKKLPTVDLKLEMISSEGRRPRKASPARGKGLRTSSTERAGTQLSTEADQQKPWNSPPKAQRPNRGSSPSSRPRRTPPLTASQPLGARSSKSLNQTETSVQITDKSSRRAQSRSPSPGGPVGTSGRRLSQHSLSTQQAPAAQTRGRVAQPQSHTPYPKPRTSFLHTYSRLQMQVCSQPPKHLPSSAQKKLEREEGTIPPDVTFSQPDSLKGLKDKMSKLSSQSKRGGAISPVKTRGGSS